MPVHVFLWFRLGGQSCSSFLASTGGIRTALTDIYIYMCKSINAYGYIYIYTLICTYTYMDICTYVHMCMYDNQSTQCIYK